MAKFKNLHVENAAIYQCDYTTATGYYNTFFVFSRANQWSMTCFVEQSRKWQHSDQSYVINGQSHCKAQQRAFHWCGKRGCILAIQIQYNSCQPTLLNRADTLGMLNINITLILLGNCPPPNNNPYLFSIHFACYLFPNRGGIAISAVFIW